MARKFRFRLEVVRRLRQQAVDAQLRDLAAIVRALTSEKQAAGELERNWERSAADGRQTRSAGPLDVAVLRAQQVHRSWLTRRLTESERALRAAEAAVGAQRIRVGEVSTRLKVIETLRQRQWEKHQGQTRREEQAAGDEAAASRFARRCDASMEPTVG